MKNIVMTVVSDRASRALRRPEKSKPGATRRAGNAGWAGHRARPSLAGAAGLMAGAIKHNGLLHKVRPVTALKLRLVRHRLRALAGCARPPLCLAPLRTCGASPALTRCSARLAPDSHGQCGSGFAATAGVSVRRFAQSLRECPRPPCGPGASAPRPRRCGPSTPRGGSLHPGAA